MPCYHPLQAVFSVRSDGKKDIQFCNWRSEAFSKGVVLSDFLKERGLGVPCGKCIGCRLEASRQKAVRCMHEAEMYDKNCFITLTYAPEFLPASGSLDPLVPSKFIKRLRQSMIPKQYMSRKMVDIRKAWVKENPIRVFYCGEYGEECRSCCMSRKYCVCSFFDKQLGRPHYHALLFNCDFDDKEYWRSIDGFKYFTSKKLSSLWPFGFSSVTDLTFESAAYVARYAVKKVNGDAALEHYKKVLPSGEISVVIPEFAQPSRRPGLGFSWIERYGDSDVFPYDEVVARGVKCKPPRYYDLYLEKKDPQAFAALKERRREKAVLREYDSTYERLLTREKCQDARMKLLIRKME